MAKPKRNTSKSDDPRQAKTRAAIKTTQLINRLQCFALGISEPNMKDGEGKPADIDSNRLRAIEILLRKALPDLTAITLDAGDAGLHVHVHQGVKGTNAT